MTDAEKAIEAFKPYYDAKDYSELDTGNLLYFAVAFYEALKGQPDAYDIDHDGTQVLWSDKYYAAVKEWNLAEAELKELKAQENPVEVTVADISRYIETWRFDDDVDGAFGSYLMKLHPQGLKIIEGGE